MSLSPIESTDTEPANGPREEEQKRKHSGQSSTPIRCRQQSTSVIDASSNTNPNQDKDTTPRPVHTKVKKTHSPPLAINDGTSNDDSELSGHSHSCPVDVDSFEEVKRWPSSFYACDVADGFAMYDQARRSGLGAKAAFTHAFGLGVHYRSSTFSEQRQRWLSAPPSACADFVAAGKTNEGCYSLFMSQYPTPRAALKAAQKHMARQGADNGSVGKQGPSRHY